MRLLAGILVLLLGFAAVAGLAVALVKPDPQTLRYTLIGVGGLALLVFLALMPLAKTAAKKLASPIA